jgi:glycolate oxidase iron-sulfur subunit
MRAVAEGRLENTSQAFRTHIDRCLGCRACEQVCPAGVEYGQLLESSREELSQAQPKSDLTDKLLRFALRYLWLSPKRLRLFFAGTRLFRDLGLAGLLRKSGIARLFSPRAEFALALLASSRPIFKTRKRGAAATAQPVEPKHSGKPNDAAEPVRLFGDGSAAGEAAPATALPPDVRRGFASPDSCQKNEWAEPTSCSRATGGAEPRLTSGGKAVALFNGCVGEDLASRGKAVALFTGCVGEGLFARVNRATERVLRANGFQVNTPADQVCCGALHAHAGDLDGARELGKRNLKAFASEGTIVTNAGGCGAMLTTYVHLFANDEQLAQAAADFSKRVRDVSQQLQNQTVSQTATNKRVTYDTSCHLLYGQHAGDASQQMLRAVVGRNFAPLEGTERCCGAAGIYNLLQPEMSQRVLQEKLDHIRETDADVLATGNPGCQMQIGAGAQLAGMKLQVCHPIELVDEAYERSGMYADNLDGK